MLVNESLQEIKNSIILYVQPRNRVSTVVLHVQRVYTNARYVLYMN
jgi:hypothetical protein